MHFYFPRLADLHNYPAGNSATAKYNNWNTLNRKPLVNPEKVLKRINFQISKNDIEHIITATPDSIERVLKVMKDKIMQYMEKTKEKQEEMQQLRS